MEESIRVVFNMNDNVVSPKFTIIIPAYNAEKFIDIAINSVLRQTLNDWELIIVENGSTDNTTAICMGFLTDKRISLLHSEKGVSTARNVGIHAAKGKWLVFLDADDQLLGDSLAKYAEIDDEYSPDLIIGEYENKRHNYSGAKKLYQNSTKKDFLQISLENPTQKCNTKAVAFRTALVHHHGICFDMQIKYAEDSVFFLEILRFSESVATVFYPVYRVIYYTQSAVRSGMRKLDMEYLPAINKIKTILDMSDTEIRNGYYIFILNQLLVILVNDIFARKKSVFEQIEDAKTLMAIPEYKNAIRMTDLSRVRGLKKLVFKMMKERFMIGVLLAVRVRQRQNRKKENNFYV